MWIFAESTIFSPSPDVIAYPGNRLVSSSAEEYVIVPESEVIVCPHFSNVRDKVRAEEYKSSAFSFLLTGLLFKNVWVRRKVAKEVKMHKAKVIDINFKDFVINTP